MKRLALLLALSLACATTGLKTTLNTAIVAYNDAWDTAELVFTAQCTMTMPTRAAAGCSPENQPAVCKQIDECDSMSEELLLIEARANAAKAQANAALLGLPDCPPEGDPATCQTHEVEMAVGVLKQLVAQLAAMQTR